MTYYMLSRPWTAGTSDYYHRLVAIGQGAYRGKGDYAMLYWHILGGKLLTVGIFIYAVVVAIDAHETTMHTVSNLITIVLFAAVNTFALDDVPIVLPETYKGSGTQELLTLTPNPNRKPYSNQF